MPSTEDVLTFLRRMRPTPTFEDRWAGDMDNSQFNRSFPPLGSADFYIESKKRGWLPQNHFIPHPTDKSEGPFDDSKTNTQSYIDSFNLLNNQQAPGPLTVLPPSAVTDDVAKSRVYRPDYVISALRKTPKSYGGGNFRIGTYAPPTDDELSEQAFAQFKQGRR